MLTIGWCWNIILFSIEEIPDAIQKDYKDCEYSFEGTWYGLVKNPIMLYSLPK
jgi:hypothetical protein